MSKIPPPTKAKALPKSSAASSEAHASLLTLTWGKLDALLSSLFDVSPVARQAAITAARDACRSQLLALADEAAKFKLKSDVMSAASAESQLEAVRRLEKRLRTQADKEPKPLDESCFAASIDGRTLEFPLYVTKGTGQSSRSDLVGFVDIACEITIPESLALACYPMIRLGLGVRSLKDFFTDPFALNGAFSVSDVDQVTMHEPEWIKRWKRPMLWIDIRPADTPVGQLIREVKALRDFAGDPDDRLLVVAETMDETKRAMLKHEDILVVTRQELELL